MVRKDTLPRRLRANRSRRVQEAEAFFATGKLGELRIARMVDAYEQLLAVENRGVDRCVGNSLWCSASRGRSAMKALS